MATTYCAEMKKKKAKVSVQKKTPSQLLRYNIRVFAEKENRKNLNFTTKNQKKKRTKK